MQPGIKWYFYVLGIKFNFCVVYVTTLSVRETAGFRRGVFGAFDLLQPYGA